MTKPTQDDFNRLVISWGFWNDPYDGGKQHLNILTSFFVEMNIDWCKIRTLNDKYQGCLVGMNSGKIFQIIFITIFKIIKRIKNINFKKNYFF